MNNLRHWIEQQGRTRTRWTVLFFALLLGALIWPSTSEAAQNAKIAIIWLFSFAAAYQLGRLLQTWSARPLLLQASPVPLQASALDSTRAPNTENPDSLSWTRPAASSPGVSHASSTTGVRAYASVEEAEASGWEFGEPIARFGGKPIPGYAASSGMFFDYVGLLPAGYAVPLDTRVFGGLAYRARQPVSPKSNIDAIDTSQVSTS